MTSYALGLWSPAGTEVLLLFTATVRVLASYAVGKGAFSTAVMRQACEANPRVSSYLRRYSYTVISPYVFVSQSLKALLFEVLCQQRKRLLKKSHFSATFLKFNYSQNALSENITSKHPLCFCSDKNSNAHGKIRNSCSV